MLFTQYPFSWCKDVLGSPLATVVSHVCGKGKFGLGSHSECHVYLDGQSVGQSLLKYPRERGSVESCFVGCDHWPPTPD